MTDAARLLMQPPELDEPARRLLFVIPAAIAIWAILLSGFSLILMRTKAPPPELQPIEARLVEIPPAVGGLQGGGAVHAPAPAIPHPTTVPIVKPHPVVHEKKLAAPMPPVIRSPYGTEKSTNAPSVGETSGAKAGTATESGASGGSETGEGSGGGGIGSDTVGARAIYAPTPIIPDDLREDVMQTEAVARFKVSFDGTIEVTLEKPTSSPRLNQVLLDTLKQWKFFPAVKNGVAINSSFEVRIPISVQ
ncbi:MAG: TonB family protein [Candidatus Binatus sp.]